MVLKNPMTLLRMSSNCNAKVYKILVRSYFRNRFLYLINSVKSFEIRWHMGKEKKASGCIDNKNALYSAKTIKYFKKKPNKTHFCLFSYHLIRLKHQIIRRCGWNALKGQPAHSPGQRPGLWERGKFALKGQKNGVLVKLLPFQGDSRTSRIPRALPRADISLALQAVLHN